MTKTIWVLPFAMLGIAVGCESPSVDDAGARGAGEADGDQDDTDLGGDTGASCTDATLDAQGCACDPGSPARACLAGSSEKPDLESCTFGTQACETTKSSEFETGVWGACTSSVCKDDGGGDQNDGDCCTQEYARCLDDGESAATCATLQDVCSGLSCEGVVAVCPPTDIPISTACAHAYQQCFGFMVNKCQRMSLDNCLYILGDEALCAEWDASCAAREVECGGLLGIEPCVGTEKGGDGKECNDGELGNLLYRCTDWGHEFDPCWQAYVACGEDVPACKNAFGECQNDHSMGPTCNPVQGTEKDDPEGGD